MKNKIETVDFLKDIIDSASKQDIKTMYEYLNDKFESVQKLKMIVELNDEKINLYKEQEALPTTQDIIKQLICCLQFQIRVQELCSLYPLDSTNNNYSQYVSKARETAGYIGTAISALSRINLDLGFNEDSTPLIFKQ
jgi:hypothetical protein